jgi:uncharacterized HAD superfamily protein
MRNNNICVDLDDTLVGWVDAFRKWYNHVYGVSLQMKEFKTYRFNLILQLSWRETQERVENFQKSDYFRKILPVEGAVEAIDRLVQQGKRLFLTTSRPDFLKENTQKLIDQYFKDKFLEVFYSSNHYTKRENCGMSKGEICKKLNASLIDDSLDYLMQCVLLGLEGILFGNYPWNQNGELPLGVTRCLTWKEILERLK